MINLRKTFRGHSYEEVQQKKREWFKRQYLENGCYWNIIREDLEPCIFFGSIKLIVEFV